MLLKILLIEDDPAIQNLVSTLAPEAGVAMESAFNGVDGLSRALDGSFDAVLIDVNLPQLGGFEVCRRLRSEQPNVPIVMLTSRADEIDKVLGLELGADDYITKPFSARELVARIKAVLRRAARTGAKAASDESPDHLRYGPLLVDMAKREASMDGRPLELTPIEFDILAFFATNPGRAFSREAVVEGVWGFQSESYDPTVTTHLSRLRRKLEPDANSPMFLLTVRGIGYRFVDAQELEGKLAP